jgi:hypothetical protein
MEKSRVFAVESGKFEVKSSIYMVEGSPKDGLGPWLIGRAAAARHTNRFIVL